MLGSAIYLKSTGISLEYNKDKCYKYIKNATYKKNIYIKTYIKKKSDSKLYLQGYNNINIYIAKAIL